MSGLVCALIATTITVLLTKYLFISSFSCCSVSRTSLISLQIWHFSQLKHLNRFSSCDKTVRHRWTTWKIFFARFTSQKEKKNNNQCIGYSSHFKRISFCFCNESMKTRNKPKTNKPFSSGPPLVYLVLSIIVLHPYLSISVLFATAARNHLSARKIEYSCSGHPHMIHCLHIFRFPMLSMRLFG